MLATGTWTAPSTYLRCQLRQIILGARLQSRPPCFIQPEKQQTRCFSKSIRRCQESEEEEEDQTFDDKDGEDAKSKLSKYPLGRVIGKPGRRQRESSARLKTNAMKKPFEVIVMRDITEPKAETSERGSVLSSPSSRVTEITAVRNASDILVAGEEPSQEEVEESIDLLRPDMSIVDEQQYNGLAKSLLDSYNSQQLSFYLTKALKLFSVDADEVQLLREESAKREGGLRRTTWKPGRTPLGQRHSLAGVLKKSEIGTNKSKVVQQILRLAWNLTVHSEMQSIGEMEVLLESWQIPYLFDLTLAEMPMYEAMIDSPLLRRNSEIRPFRPDNIMRITARRQDAEEIADQIERKLQEVKNLEVNLAVFKSILGRAGRPRTLEQLCAESVLKDVERRTATVIERRDAETLTIHGRSEVSLGHAERVLLSTLNLPSPRTSEITDVIAASTDIQGSRHSHYPLLLPDHTCSNLSFRHRDLQLGRLSTPSKLAAKQWHLSEPSKDQIEDESRIDDLQDVDTALRTHTQHLVQRLSHIKPYYPVDGSTTTDRSSYWTFRKSLESQSWDVQLCKILHPYASSLDIATSIQGAFRGRKDKLQIIKSLINGSKQSVVQPRIPGIADLLSFFSPKHAQSRPPSLIAHFIPSPFTKGGVAAMSTLPRIAIRYGFSHNDHPSDPGQHQGLVILGMRATLADQELRVPLPHEAADLCIHRATTLLTRKGRVLDDLEISRFTQTLESSAMRGDAALEGKPMVKFRLPHWLLAIQRDSRRSEKPRKDVEFEYLFEKFEQVQTVDFAPLRGAPAMELIDPRMKDTLNGMPKHLFLEYKEIEGGVVGGRRTELRLKYEPLPQPICPLASQPEKAPSASRSINTREPEVANAVEVDEDERTMNVDRDTMRSGDVRLLETGLRLANALTRINTGELRPLQSSSVRHNFDS